MSTNLDSPFSVKGLTAVVTGGSSGIGRATAILLAQHGARVWSGDLKQLPENAAQFQSLGIAEIACDVRDEASVQRLIQTATAATNQLDIVVHSAGVVLVRAVVDTTEAEWDKVIDTNFKGAFLLAKHAIPVMQRTGGGAITLLSSNAGILPRTHDPIYSTCKGGVNSLAKSLALCYAPDKIRVNAVCPGPVANTGIIDNEINTAANPVAMEQRIVNSSPMCKTLGRMVLPEEVAQAILYLSSPAALLVTGTLIAIDGGKSLGVPAN